MATHTKTARGFVTMLVMMLLVVVIIVGLAYLRIKQAHS